MGVYYTLYNLTKAEKVLGYWKAYPYCDCDKVMKQRGWDKNDIILSIGDGGYVYRIRVLEDDQIDLEEINPMDFLYDVETDQTRDILANYPKSFTEYEYVEQM